MTTKRLAARLENAEARAAPAAQVCQCPRASVDYRRGITEAGADGGPEVCDVCGLPIDRIPVVLTTFDAESLDLQEKGIHL